MVWDQEDAESPAPSDPTPVSLLCAVCLFHPKAEHRVFLLILSQVVARACLGMVEANKLGAIAMVEQRSTKERSPKKQ